MKTYLLRFSLILSIITFTFSSCTKPLDPLKIKDLKNLTESEWYHNHSTPRKRFKINFKNDRTFNLVNTIGEQTRGTWVHAGGNSNLVRLKISYRSIWDPVAYKFVGFTNTVIKDMEIISLTYNSLVFEIDNEIYSCQR